MKKVPFKVSARAARLIGRENVATSQGAVTELVKNAYDADAGACAIYFLRRHTGTPEVLSAEEFSNLSAVLKDADRFYTEGDKAFELVDQLSEDDLASLSKGLDDLVDLWCLNNVTPADVYFGRDKAILREREKIKKQTIRQRRLHHEKQAA